MHQIFCLLLAVICTGLIEQGWSKWLYLLFFLALWNALKSLLFGSWSLALLTQARNREAKDRAQPRQHPDASADIAPAARYRVRRHAIRQPVRDLETGHDSYMELDSISSTEDAMCLAHITDAYLLRRVEQSAEEGDCAICIAGSLTPSGQVVNLEHVARVVEEVAQNSYDHEGWVSDGAQILEPLNTEEVLTALLEDAIDPEALDLTVGLLTMLIREELDWFEPFNMDREDGFAYEWDRFEERVKHESRLLLQPRGDHPNSAPERNYAFIESLLLLAEERAGLIRTLRRGTKLYRARSERDALEFERIARDSPARQLGPAPRERASAGRMNAQGIPLFYVALDPETACAEVASHSPYDEAVVGRFVVQKPLRVLDLTTIPAPQSAFDGTAIDEIGERLSALSVYRDRITRPVILDGNHPVDYAPTQVFTDAFRFWPEKPLDGIMYPSRVRDGGTNIVLFFGDRMWFESPTEKSSRFEAFIRQTEHQQKTSLFHIDPKTIRRFRVKREISVDKAGLWIMNQGRS